MLQITAAGNVGKDAVLRNTQGGDSVVSFSVGCKVQKGREQSTEWLSCSLWGKRGEALAQYLTKGAPVTVTGSLSTREHEGKTYLECRVSEVALQGGKRDAQPQQGGYGGGYGGKPSQQSKPAYADLDGDEIPF
jgi:single-strand DNA-binding protein